MDTRLEGYWFEWFHGLYSLITHRTLPTLLRHSQLHKFVADVSAVRIFVYRQYSDKTMITDKKAAELILGHFVRRGTDRTQPFSAGAHATACPGLAPPLLFYCLSKTAVWSFKKACTKKNRPMPNMIYCHSLEMAWPKLTRPTPRRVPYKWRQICRISSCVHV